MKEDAESSWTNKSSSRLLIWPRRRHRPKENTGYVLGWKKCEVVPHSTCYRETTVCAGIVPAKDSLQKCRERLAEFRDNTSVGKPRRCSCLTRSLEIVAVWTATPSTAVPSEANSLKIVTQQRRGFPWWMDEDDDNGRTIYKQLVLYDPPGMAKNDVFAHFESEYGRQGAGNEWSLILDQLNHGHEVVNTFEAGLLPEEHKKKVSDLPNMRSSLTKEHQRAASSFWNALKSYLIKNSMTLLHFQQLARQHDKTRVLSWFSFLSLGRCRLSLPSDPPGDKCTHICRHCGRETPFQNRPRAAQSYVARWDQYLEATLDLSLGIGAALLLFMAWRYSNPSSNLWTYYSSARVWSLNLLIDAIEWLEKFPAGFKLNEALTHNMGQVIRNVLCLQQICLESTLWNVEYGQGVLLPLLFSLSALCGWSGLLAVLMDLWRLENVPLWFLAITFRYLYRIELFLLSALFRLFRGKKRNILRQRTDSMQYDAMQLLLGTVAFCICIFLWTTIMVYYVFFVIANWVFNLPVAFLWASYIITRSIPWGSLGWRLWRPRWFSKSVHLRPMSEDGQDIRVARLCSVAENPATIVLAKIAPHVSALLLWMLNTLFEALFPRNLNEAPCSMPFSRFMNEFHA